ncbi:MAG TPA: SDR family NAD(P)-dependent oxidoreductase [Spirochaetales bacterium]|nr:SDR family NAD(P)-dependent oxidoreductase [Spirochaetales bacterium]HRY54876.1 SDR family NAD(P)-dependent oxidoreductase [Spirochaetia bacterium]HRZ63608.1 SDR family NAD(P)-dependent oxidoreductase [Spirochaetia bacterium]
MSELDHSLAAPLARGLYLEAAGSPLAVSPGPLPPASARGPLELELPGSARGSASGFDEDSAARAAQAAFAAWRAADPARSGLVPGCVVARDGQAAAAYWPGAEVGEARARAARADCAAFAPAPRPPAAAGSAEGREAVVRGRVALVTGGAQGFGEEIARGLAASGATVFVADLNAAGAEKLAAAINAESGRAAAFGLAVNVSDEASVRAMFDQAAAIAGGLDLVVSNAGVLKAGSVLEQDSASFRFVTEVNYHGFFLVAKYAGLLLRRQRRTAPRWATDIVQVNSKSGLEGSNRNGAYAGSKFGGIGLVQSFALELVEHGIKVNAICPGNFLDGPLWSDPDRGLFVQYLRSGKVPGAKTIAEVRSYYEAKVPMRRGCEGADVMRAIYYAVEQAYETGQALPVTGGQVMLA